jgi:probable RNA-binding protein EIF1AD
MGKPKSSLQQDELSPSTLPSDHTIVKLGAAQGSGNYLSHDSEAVERLVELSGRVKRSKIIITRGKYPWCLQYLLRGAQRLMHIGDFAFVRLYPADPEGGKSKLMGEIVAMISSRDVKSWRKTGEWYVPSSSSGPRLTDEKAGWIRRACSSGGTGGNTLRIGGRGAWEWVR